MDGTRTDDRGRFLFRLPPGETYIYSMNLRVGRGSMTVNIPEGPEHFKAPDLVIEGQPLDLKNDPKGDFVFPRIPQKR